jgi:hypothetical protein
VIERSTGGGTTRLDLQRTALAAVTDSRYVHLLLPPSSTRRATMVATELSKTLPKDGFVVSTVAWPPNIAELRGKFVISLLELDRPLLSCLEAADFDTLRRTILQAGRLLWVCARKDPRMEIAVGLLRVVQSENTNKRYQHLLLEDQPGRSVPDISRPIAKVVTTETPELEISERDGWLHIQRWIHEPEMTRTVARSDEMLNFGTALLGKLRPFLGVRMLHGAELKNAHFVSDISHHRRLLPDEVEIEIRSIVLNDDDTNFPETVSLREASGVVKAVGHSVSDFRPTDRVCSFPRPSVQQCGGQGNKLSQTTRQCVDVGSRLSAYHFCHGFPRSDRGRTCETSPDRARTSRWYRIRQSCSLARKSSRCHRLCNSRRSKRSRVARSTGYIVKQYLGRG